MLFTSAFLATATLSPSLGLYASPDETLTEDLLLLLPHTVTTVWGDPALRGYGLVFAASLFTILLAHELGHWFACRYHRLASSPPYFLPSFLGLGTFGAFLRIREPIPTRRALFDVGAAGPFAGFIVLIPFLLYGVAHSRAVVPPAPTELTLLLELGRPLAIDLAARLVGPSAPPGAVFDYHPMAFAAWFGLLVTAINLIPIGQLDGGHILYSLGIRQSKRITIVVWLALAACGFLWHGWWLWCAITAVLRFTHPPVLDEFEPLSRGRRGLAFAAALVFVLAFSPKPLDLIELSPIEPRQIDRDQIGPSDGVEDERHGPIVDQLDFHRLTKPPRFDRQAPRAQSSDEVLVKCSRLVGGRGSVERRTAPSCERACEGELRNHEQSPRHLAEITVHLSRVVFEHPQRRQFFGRCGDVFGSVTAHDSDEHEQSVADLADRLSPYANARREHPL